MQANRNTLSLFFGLLVACLSVGCSSVNVLRLTSETFSPRSVEEVAILSEAPPTEHTRIAELSRHPPPVSILQRHILKKAAQLGADAVIFSVPHTRSEQRVDYQPVYSPWGYYAPYYYYGPGPFGYSRPWGYSYSAFGPFGGYRQYAAIPYERVTTLKGVAIRYSG